MYLAAWICVAGIAVIYLYGLISGGIGGQTRTAGEMPLRELAGAPDSDTSTLAGQIEVLRREIYTLKQRELLLETRVADLQSALGPMTSSLAAKKSAPPVAVARSPMPANGFGDGLTETSPIPIAAASQPTRTLFAVELGTDPTIESLRKRWRGLLAKHTSVLKDLEIRYVAVKPSKPGEKTRLRLIAGPFSNAADAAKLCAKLKARRRSCLQTTFAGEGIEDKAAQSDPAADKKVQADAPSVPERKPNRRTN